MTAVPLDAYVATVRRSKLVDDDRLKDAVRELEKELGAAPQSLDLARRLEEKKLLTTWQNEKLLAGKHNGFFLGKYKILSHLGTGGMSTVYLAEHTLMRRRVAIKVLPIARVNDSSYLDRFLREARAIAALDHPNIVRAFNVDNQDKLYYIVMEFVEGQDLEKVAQGAGQLEYEKAADYIRQAADGLSHAHAKGMIHRDIKPSNLLLDKEGTIKLLDMGLAMLTGRDERALTVEHKENVLGTTDYLAPEQAINSHEIDLRADIYSLGCTLYYLLTGHPPFPTGTLAQRLMKHQCEEPKPITDDRPDAPADLVEICRIMRAKKPEDRYQTAAEVSEAMAGWMRKHGFTPTARRGGSEHGLRSASPGDESTVSLRLGGSSLDLKESGRGSGSAKTVGASAPTTEEPLTGFLQTVGQEAENSSILDTRVATGSSVSGRRGSSVSRAPALSGSGIKRAPGGLPPTVWAGIGGGAVVVLLLLFFVMGSPGNSTGAGGSGGGASGSGSRTRGSTSKTKDLPDEATFRGFPVGKLHVLTFEVPEAGPRNLTLKVTDGPTNASARVLLNGKEIQKDLKMPEIGIGPEKSFSLGVHDLKKGDNDLSVEVSGGGGRQRPSWVKYDRWQLIGPFPNDNESGYDQKFPPEQEPFDASKEYDGKNGKVKWAQKNYKDGDNHSLNDTFPGAKENITYYLYRKVKADKDGTTQFFFGSDDSLKVWVNGKLVTSFKGGRGVEAYSNEASVDLKKGDNTLLLKICQGSGDTGFTFTDVPNPNRESSRQFRFGLAFPAK